MILELDDRFLAGSDLDLTWQAGAVAFSLPGARPVGEPASLHPVGRQP
jgi:hypothetical protein